MSIIIAILRVLLAALLGAIFAVLFLAPLGLLAGFLYTLFLKFTYRRDIKRASRIDTPQSELLALARHVNRFVWKAVAQNPNAPREALFIVAPKFPGEFLKNPATAILLLEDPNLLWNFALDKDGKHFWLHPKVPFDFLKEAVAHTNPEIRELLCYNKGLPLSLRLQLMRDENEEIANHAAQYLTFWEIFWLSRANEDWKRAKVASLYKCFWYARLMDDRSARVRLAVVQNPRVKAEQLAKLSRDRDIRVRTAVASHAKTPPSAIERLRRDPEPEVRNAVRPYLRRG
jgi:hypothetical protein